MTFKLWFVKQKPSENKVKSVHGFHIHVWILGWFTHYQKCYGNRAEINSMHKVTKIPGKVQNTGKYDINKNIMQVQLISQAWVRLCNRKMKLMQTNQVEKQQKESDTDDFL